MNYLSTIERDFNRAADEAEDAQERLQSELRYHWKRRHTNPNAKAEIRWAVRELRNFF